LLYEFWSSARNILKYILTLSQIYRLISFKRRYSTLIPRNLFSGSNW